MKKQIISCLCLILLLLSAMALAAAPGGDDPRPGPERRPGYQLDNRYHHNRYYPVRGTHIRQLPRGYRSVPWRGINYYFFSGSWYLSSGSGFIVARPPVGLLVPFLPPFYTTIWVGSLPYYYADGTYYQWVPERRAYRISAAPPEQEVIPDRELPQKLYIYPKQEQTAQQQANDRYECHRWAKEEAGFDPTLPAGGVAEGLVAQKRSDYQRAMKACLEARGYSVQ